MRLRFFILATTAAALFSLSYEFTAPLTMTRQIGIPIWMGAADMNRDGIKDLVVIHSGAPLRVRGAVTIGVAVVPEDGALVVSETPFSGDILDAAIGEFTGDADPDLAVIDRGAFGTDRLCVAAGTGAGSVGTTYCTNLPENADHVAVADFDGDGRMDAVLTHPLTGQISLWLGRGDGSFTAGPTANVANPGVVATGDLNRDGIGDVVIHSRAGRVVLLLSANRKPLQITQSFLASPTFNAMGVGDLNGDGNLDVAASDSLSSSYFVAFGRGAAAPYLSEPATTETELTPRLMQLADLNGDGIPEFVASTPGGMMVLPVMATGRVAVAAGVRFSPAVSVPFATLDLNRDKLPDVVLYTGTAGQAMTQLFSRPTPTAVQAEWPAQRLAFGQRLVVTARAVVANPPFPLFQARGGKFVVRRNGQVFLEAVGTPPVVTNESGAGPREIASARLEMMLPPGESLLAITYSGESGFLGSTSTAVTLVTESVQPSVRLVSAVREIPREQGLRLAVAVTGTAGVPVVGTARLVGQRGIVAEAAVTNGQVELAIPAGLPLGTWRARVQFSGDGYVPVSTDELVFVVRGGLTAGNAASYRGSLAPDALAVAAIPGLEHAATAATRVPWPATLGLVSAEWVDGGGTGTRLGLVYVGNGQVNLYVPAGVRTGAGRLQVRLEDQVVATGEAVMAAAAPGVFLQGQAAAALTERLADGSGWVVTLFGTGWRGAREVKATYGGVPAEVLYAGAQPETPGLDQLNLRIAAGGPMEAELVVTADGQAANTARLALP